MGIQRAHYSTAAPADNNLADSIGLRQSLFGGVRGGEAAPRILSLAVVMRRSRTITARKMGLRGAAPRALDFDIACDSTLFDTGGECSGIIAQAWGRGPCLNSIEERREHGSTANDINHG